MGILLSLEDKLCFTGVLYLIDIDFISRKPFVNYSKVN